MWTWVANVLVNAATNYATGNNMLAALIVAILAAGIFLAVWHRNRVKEGHAGVEPWHLQIAGLIGIIIFAGVALSGVIWQIQVPAAIPPEEAAKLTKPLQDQVNSLNGQLAEAKAKTEQKPLQAGPGALYAPGSSGGKLEVGKVVGAIPRIAEDHGQNNSVLIGETNDGSAPLSKPAPLPWPGTEFSGLTNAELKKLALSKSIDLRPLALKLNERVTHPQTMMEARKEVQKRFIDEFRGTCSAIAAEILARQKIFPPYDFQVIRIYPGALSGGFAGPNPVAEVSAFLEDRARMLPDD